MFYLKAKPLDFISGYRKRKILISTKIALEEGVYSGSKLEIVSLANVSKRFIVYVDLCDDCVDTYSVGIDKNTWEDLEIQEGDLIGLNWVPQPKSLEAIRKKLLKNKLNYSEIKSILDDIVSGKLGDIEASYFAACGFNPGFDDEELYYLTKAMAESGEQIKWPYEMVVDKHSIGGLAGKGITPILVSIISSKGLVIPNTSTRAITAPAGTTDVMEVFCNMEFSITEIQELVKKNNACIVWGGGLDLAPADEALIEIEKPIGIELYDKFIVSILAKKIATGLTHLVIDVPYGHDTKIEKYEDALMVKKKFEKLANMFNIKIKVHLRESLGPDGRGVGPNLEAIDLLKVLLQRDDRYLHLENISLVLAGELLELSGLAKLGKGYDSAKKELTSGRAYQQFRKLIKAQGGNPEIMPEDIKLGKYKYSVFATRDGVVKDIVNLHLKEVAHALGNPVVKQAGIFLHKQVGESVHKNDILMDIYSTSESRLDLAKKMLDIKEIIIY